MIERITIRRKYLKDRVVGLLSFKNLRLYTLELADNNNQRNISCIPEGTYKAKIRNYKGYRVLQLLNVSNRDGILVHRGNTIDDSKGCILVGKSKSEDDSKVLNSTIALNELISNIKSKDIEVKITSNKYLYFIGLLGLGFLGTLVYRRFF